MRTKLLLALVFLVAFARLASAQGPQIFWTQGNVSTAAQAQAMTFAITVTPNGGAPLAPITLTSVACVNTPAACSAPLPAAGVAALITGAKTTMTATDANGTSPSSAPFTQLPAAPVITKVG